MLKDMVYRCLATPPDFLTPGTKSFSRLCIASLVAATQVQPPLPLALWNSTPTSFLSASRLDVIVFAWQTVSTTLDHLPHIVALARSPPHSPSVLEHLKNSTYRGSSSAQPPSPLPNFIAYGLHRTKLHSSVTFAALILLQCSNLDCNITSNLGINP
ncbi:hypothetical protein FPV67DRAFT_1673742 [Lyophyllum atratum]|nr:hypothetical protein FPV67DRAFT_1673742 [Lyophyllum atratum]